MKNKLVQPVSGGRAKVPVVMQMEALECGAACLTMVLDYYKKWIPLERVRVACGVSRDGSNALNVAKAARNYGLEAKGHRYEPEALKKSTFPCIIHWNFNHFVVLCGFKGNKALINDPARGSVKVPMEEFDKSFTGICITFAPGPAFEPEGKRRSTLDFIRHRLTGAGAAVALVILSTIIGYLFEILNPAFSRFFMDRLLTQENAELLNPFIAILAAAGLLQILVSAMQTYYSLKISAKMDMLSSSTFLWKVLRMPIEFFSQRQTGDILQRQGTNAGIAGAIVSTVIPLVLNLIMMVVYLVVMIRYSLILTLIGLGTVVINLFVSRIISTQRINITRVQKRDMGKLSATTTSGMQMIETIKSSGAENGFFQKWAGYQASVNAQTVRFERISRLLGLIPSLLSSLADISVLIIGVWLTMKGEFTIGMIMTFQGFMGAFMSAANAVIGATQSIQEMRTDMERIEDVMKLQRLCS